MMSDEERLRNVVRAGLLTIATTMEKAEYRCTEETARESVEDRFDYFMD
jgi:hypothetical protein